jgi:hypothetical protein
MAHRLIEEVSAPRNVDSRRCAAPLLSSDPKGTCCGRGRDSTYGVARQAREGVLS